MVALSFFVAAICILPTVGDTMYKILPIENKGLGCVACRTIKIGELILSERPLLSLSTRKTWFQSSNFQTTERIGGELNRLSDTEIAEFFELHAYSSCPTDDLDLSMKALGIFKTNAYPTGPDMAGVFPRVSRLNSGCNPNVHYNWDTNSNLGTIHAIKEIKSGEEFLNCYIGLYLPKLERMSYLVSNFGFQCQCSCCLLDDVESEKSDIRRNRLGSLRETMRSKSSTLDKMRLTSLYAERRTLLAEENIETAATLYECEMDAIVAYGVDNADTRSLQAALNYAVLSKGRNSPQAEEIRSMLSAIEIPNQELSRG